MHRVPHGHVRKKTGLPVNSQPSLDTLGKGDPSNRICEFHIPGASEMAMLVTKNAQVQQRETPFSRVEKTLTQNHGRPSPPPCIGYLEKYSLRL